MRTTPRLRHFAFVLVCCALLAACGLADIFRPPGLGDVVLTYGGPETMNVGDTATATVNASVGGDPLPNARFAITSLDKGVVVVRGDTLIAVGFGWDTLTIRLVGSIFTDSLPTVLQQVRVLP